MKNLFHSRSDEQHLARNDQISAILGSLIFIILTTIFILIPDRSFFLGYSWWMLPGGLVVYILGQMWNLFWLFRLERRRFTSFSKGCYLSRAQPMPLPFAVQRVSVISWHIKWTYIIPWLLVTGWWLVFAHGNVFALTVIIGIVLLLYSFLRFEIEITEKGLVEKEVGLMKKTIDWSEARFFACYRVPVLFWNKNIVHYELSSSTTRVSWVWVHNLESPFTAWKPGLPPDEYEQQMQALCALVREKTGLLLYDLSKPRKDSHT